MDLEAYRRLREGLRQTETEVDGGGLEPRSLLVATLIAAIEGMPSVGALPKGMAVLRWVAGCFHRPCVTFRPPPPLRYCCDDR